MKQLIIFNFIILSLNFFSSLLSVNYPGPLTDKPVEIYTTNLNLSGGDKVGYASTLETHSDVNTLGLVFCAGGIKVSGSTSNYYILFASPLPVCREIYLKDTDATQDWFAIMEDLHLSSSVNLLASGEIMTKYGSIILNGTFNLMGNRITVVETNLGRPVKFHGKGNILDFTNRGQLLLNSSGHIIFDNVYLNNLKQDCIHFNYPADSVLTFSSSKIRIDGDICFNHDVVIGAGEVVFTGTGHTICFNKRLEVQNGAKLKMDYFTTFSLGHRGYIATNGNGIFHFNGCNIELGGNVGQVGLENNGFYISDGLVLFENEVVINDDGNHKHFIIGKNSLAKTIGLAQIHLDGTITISSIL